MRRRALLTLLTLGVVALAGCSAAASLSLDRAYGTAIADDAARSVDALDGEAARLVRGAVRDDAATAVGKHPPFDPEQPIEVNGSYYNVTWSIVDTDTVQEFVIDIEATPANTSGSRIAYANLPAVDRQTLPDLSSPLSSDEAYVNPAARYDASERERSVLVPTPEYRLITAEGQLIRVSDVQVRNVTVRSYRYTVTELADSEEAFARQLRSESLFALSDLSDGEARIVEKAIEKTQYADRATEPWKRLTEALSRARTCG